MKSQVYNIGLIKVLKASKKCNVLNKLERKIMNFQFKMQMSRVNTYPRTIQEKIELLFEMILDINMHNTLICLLLELR